MTRRMLLFFGLVAAVSLAVALRTASSQAEAIVALPDPGRDASHDSLLNASDCTISTDHLSHLVSSDVAQLAQTVPGDAAEIDIAPQADEQRLGLAPEAETTTPARMRHALRPTIRPPPLSA